MQVWSVPVCEPRFLRSTKTSCFQRLSVAPAPNRMSDEHDNCFFLLDGSCYIFLHTSLEIVGDSICTVRLSQPSVLPVVLCDVALCVADRQGMPSLSSLELELEAAAGISAAARFNNVAPAGVHINVRPHQLHEHNSSRK
jgi:hypothetical protein